MESHSLGLGDSAVWLPGVLVQLKALCGMAAASHNQPLLTG